MTWNARKGESEKESATRNAPVHRVCIDTRAIARNAKSLSLTARGRICAVQLNLSMSFA